MIGLIKGTARQARTVSGLPLPIASYKSNSKLPIQELSLSINPTQSGSGDPAPDNIRPITGVSSVKVCNTPMPVAPLWSIDSSFNGHVNFNQYCKNDKTSVTQDGITYTNNGDGTWTIRGTAEATTIAYIVTNTAPVNSTRMYWYGEKSIANTYRIGDFNNGNSISFSQNGAIVSGVTTVNLSIGVQVYSGKSIDITITPMVFDLTQMFGSTIADYIYSLEQGTAGAGVAFFRSIYPNDYYAYDTGTDEMVGSREGNTYTIALGDTYYGATLDVVRGKLALKYVKSIVDKAMLRDYGSGNMTFHNYGKFSMRNLFYASNSGATGNYYNRKRKDGGYYCKSNVFNVLQFNDTLYMSTQYRTVMTSPSGVTDYASWQTFMQNLIDNDVEVYFVYEFTEGSPIEIDLTPTQINTLLGSNNVWHDGNGDVEVLKFMDRQLYFGR